MRQVPRLVCLGVPAGRRAPRWRRSSWERPRCRHLGGRCGPSGRCLWLHNHGGPGLGPVLFLWSLSAIVPVPVRSAANSCSVGPSPALATPRLFEPRPPRRRSTRWDAGRVLFPSIATLWGKSPALHACGECLDLPLRAFDRRTLASASSSPSARHIDRSLLCLIWSVWRQVRPSCRSHCPPSRCPGMEARGRGCRCSRPRPRPLGWVIGTVSVPASPSWHADWLVHWVARRHWTWSGCGVGVHRPAGPTSRAAGGSASMPRTPCGRPVS